MKKSRIVLALALLLVVAMLVVSCGDTPSPESLISEEYVYESAPVYSKAEKIDSLTGTSQRENGTYFSVHEATNSQGMKEYTVFSKVTGEVIGKWTNTADYTYTVSARISDINGRYIPGVMVKKVSVTDSDNWEAMYYAPNGELIVTETDENQLDRPVYSYEHLFLDGKVYQYDKESGSATKVADIANFNVVPQRISAIYDGFIYSYSKDGKDGIWIYDLSCNLVASWIAPNYAVGDVEDYVLEDGNVVIQYFVKIDDTAEDYDLIFSNSYLGHNGKYNLVTLIMNKESGDVDEHDVDYLIFDLFPMDLAEGDVDYYDKDKIKNFAIIARIEDRRINENDLSFEYVNLDNDLSIDDVIRNSEESASVRPISPDRYILSYANGSYALLDENFDEIGRLTESPYYYGPYFLLGEERIYDKNLTLLYTVDDDDTICRRFTDALLVAKKTSEGTDYVLYAANGEQKTVLSINRESTSAIDYLGSGEYFSIVSTASNGDKTYTYYNTNGDVITSQSFKLSYFYNTESFSVLIGTGSDGKTVWYKFS
ncbi:MAG: hypothetical protein IKA74_02710 [Clostridia bacterium]|nr:hypothetical protein [Clostridia bacterium]